MTSPIESFSLRLLGFISADFFSFTTDPTPRRARRRAFFLRGRGALAMRSLWLCFGAGFAVVVVEILQVVLIDRFLGIVFGSCIQLGLT